MSKIINITRKKDDYTFIFDSGKEAHYNFETQIKIGVSGKQVKKLNYESRILSFITAPYVYDCQRELCDRLISLPIDYAIKENALCRIYCASDCQYVLDRWKMFLKYLKTSMEDNFGSWYSIEIFKESLPKITSPEFYECLRGYNFDTELIKKYKALSKTLLKIEKEMIAFKEKRKALLNGKTEDEFCKEYRVSFSNIRYIFSDEIRHTFGQFMEVDDLIKKLQLTDYEVTNIEQSIRDLRSMLNEKESEIFGKFQSEGNLEYENDKYKIIVPKTRGELAEYGNFFGNCLNGFEWNNFLSNHTRYAVIVYDKEKKTPVVCTDISVNGRDIEQYLGKRNSSICNDELQSFRKEYQKFLHQEKGE